MKCPDCSGTIPYKADECPGCGFVVNRTKGKQTRDRDPDTFRCAWISNGARCHYAGSISASTVGGGPWYCAGHADAATSEFPVEAGDRITKRSIEEHPSPSFTPESMRLAALRIMERRGKLIDELNIKTRPAA